MAALDNTQGLQIVDQENVISYALTLEWYSNIAISLAEKTFLKCANARFMQIAPWQFSSRDIVEYFVLLMEFTPKDLSFVSKNS